MQIYSSEWKDLVRNASLEIGIDVDAHALDLFSIHADNLLKWNDKINLTAITDPYQVALKHYVDSIYITKVISSHSTVLDIGSGPGFPGIPAKIMLPEAEFTLIDAVRKKVSFVKECIRMLKLRNIKAFHARAERFAGMPEFPGFFDVVCFRAFSDLEACIKLAFPLLKEGGKLIAMKGSGYEKELMRIKDLKIQLPDGEKVASRSLNIEVLNYDLPEIHSGRSIVQIHRNL